MVSNIYTNIYPTINSLIDARRWWFLASNLKWQIGGGEGEGWRKKHTYSDNCSIWHLSEWYTIVCHNSTEPVD